MARGVWIIVVTILLLTALGAIYYFMFGKSQGSITLNPPNSQAQGTQPRQAQGQGYQRPVTLQGQSTPNYYGGKRNKKLKSKRMDTTGIYLLLGAVIVGYITSKFA